MTVIAQNDLQPAPRDCFPDRRIPSVECSHLPYSPIPQNTSEKFGHAVLPHAFSNDALPPSHPPHRRTLPHAPAINARPPSFCNHEQNIPPPLRHPPPPRLLHRHHSQHPTPIPARNPLPSTPASSTPAAELNFIKQKVAAHEEPWFTAWQALQKSPKASLDYQPRPIPNLFRGSRNNPNYGANDWLIAGGVAYTHAIEYVITSNPAHAQKAIQILNAYSTTVQSVKGSDAPLVTGEATVLYCNAAEIIRYTSTLWKPQDQQKFADLLRNVLYPVIKDFKPGNNGNWDAAMIQSMLAIGIYLDDRDIFNRAVAQATSPTSNGALQNYFNDFGECQESGRDQGHAQMGLGFLGTACEIAWKQHVDLYAAFDNRLAKGTEYICKYNLGNDVPYVEYKSVAGHNDFPNISPNPAANSPASTKKSTTTTTTSNTSTCPSPDRSSTSNAPNSTSPTPTPPGAPSCSPTSRIECDKKTVRRPGIIVQKSLFRQPT